MQHDDEQNDGDDLQPTRRRPVLWIVDGTLLPSRPVEPKTMRAPTPINGWLRNPYGETEHVDAPLT
jgi:hypothetical protein